MKLELSNRIQKWKGGFSYKELSTRIPPWNGIELCHTLLFLKFFKNFDHPNTDRGTLVEQLIKVLINGGII